MVGLDPHGHDRAWRELERFAATFDPDAWAAAGNPPLDGAALLERTRAQLAEGGFPTAPLPELRAALAAWLAAGAPTGDAAPVDALLDAVHLRLTDMQRRRWVAPPPLEPPIGPRGAGPGTAFAFTAADGDATREDVHARVAGLLLRAGAAPAALHLAAAHYPRTAGGPPRREDRFTLWPPDERRARLAVAALADLTRPHVPPLPADPTAADVRALCPPRPLAAAGYVREDGPARGDAELQLVLDGPALVVSSPSGMHLRGLVLHVALTPAGLHVATVTRSFSGTGVPAGVLGLGPPHATLGAAAGALAAAVAGWEASAEHHSPGLQPALTAAEREIGLRPAAAALHEDRVRAAAWWARVEHVVRGAYGPPAAAPITWGADPVPLRA